MPERHLYSDTLLELDVGHDGCAVKVGGQGLSFKQDSVEGPGLGGPSTVSKNYSCCSLSVFTTIPDTQKPKTERKDDTVACASAGGLRPLVKRSPPCSLVSICKCTSCRLLGSKSESSSHLLPLPLCQGCSKKRKSKRDLQRRSLNV